MKMIKTWAEKDESLSEDTELTVILEIWNSAQTHKNFPICNLKVIICVRLSGSIERTGIERISNIIIRLG